MRIILNQGHGIRSVFFSDKANKKAVLLLLDFTETNANIPYKYANELFIGLV